MGLGPNSTSHNMHSVAMANATRESPVVTMDIEGLRT
jgi:hypothetical protein